MPWRESCEFARGTPGKLARLEEQEVGIAEHGGEGVVYARAAFRACSGQEWRAAGSFEREVVRHVVRDSRFDAPQRFTRDQDQHFRPAVTLRNQQRVRVEFPQARNSFSSSGTYTTAVEMPGSKADRIEADFPVTYRANDH